MLNRYGVVGLLLVVSFTTVTAYGLPDEPMATIIHPVGLHKTAAELWSDVSGAEVAKASANRYRSCVEVHLDGMCVHELAKKNCRITCSTTKMMRSSDLQATANKDPPPPPPPPQPPPPSPENDCAGKLPELCNPDAIGVKKALP